jgi:serine/threonine protein kinase
MSDRIENEVSGVGLQTEEFLQNGSVIDQRYEVINALSYGDGRAVYLCRLLAGSRKEVAMKVLHRPRPGEDFATTAKRFRTELVAAYNITHANVVHVFEFIENQNFLAYTMEYVSGGNLEGLIEENGIFNSESARRSLSQICAGLHAIHEQGIIHREVKPRNILLTQDGDIKITDFGVARVKKHKNLTVQGGLVGTMDYLSPEYITEGKLDKSLDIYSVGVIGYQMLTGQVPFEGSDMMTMLTRRLTEVPQHPSELNPECPKKLGDIVLKALEREPEDRFESSLEMHLALDSLGTLNVGAPFEAVIESVVAVEEQEIESSFDTAPEPQVDSGEQWRQPTQLSPIDSSFSEVEDASEEDVEVLEALEVDADPNSSWSRPSWDGEDDGESQGEEISVAGTASVSYFENQNIEATLTGQSEFEDPIAENPSQELEVLTAIHRSASTSIDQELHSDLLDTFDEDENEEGIFGQPTSTMSPTVSDLHRAIEARSTVRISNPKLLYASAACVALGLGMLVNLGSAGKTDSAQAVWKDTAATSQPKNQEVKTDNLEAEAKSTQAVSSAVGAQGAMLSPEEEEGAISEYKLLLSLNPGDPKVNYNLGLLYVGRGEYGTAERYLAEAVRLDPANSTAEYYLKKVRRKLAKNS